jgi:hypothetical protein
MMAKFLFLGLLALGLPLFAFGIYFPFQALGAMNWEPVEGEILETRIQMHSSISDTGAGNQEYRRQYSPLVQYQWTVNGDTYTGDRYRLGESMPLHKTSAEARQAAKAFPRGGKITVYFDPGAPSSAVLERSVSWAVFVPLILSGLFLGGAVLVHRNRDLLEAAAKQTQPSPTPAGGGVVS